MKSPPNPPTPPPCRIIREGGRPEFCHICGSSLKRRWFGLGKVIGCLQPKCWNWHGWSQLPMGHKRPGGLYGEPSRPTSPPPAPMPGSAHVHEWHTADGERWECACGAVKGDGQ